MTFDNTETPHKPDQAVPAVFNGDFSDKTLLFTTDDITGRGMAFLFVRYLFEQKGAVTYASDGTLSGSGTAFLQKLHTSSKQGTEAVTRSASRCAARARTTPVRPRR